MNKPMTNEEMAAKLERDAKFYDDHRTPVLLAIARRIRLLGAVANVWRTHRESVPATYAELNRAMDALDADERGEETHG